MKKFSPLLLAFLGLLLAGLMPHKAKATHAAGGEILYEWISDSTYKVYFKFYRDCAGTTEPASVSMCYRNECNGLGGSVTLNKMLTLPGGSNGQEVIVPCPTTPTTCNGGTYPGYREWWYSANVTLPSRCAFWHFWVYIGSRNNAIDNIVGASGQNLFVEATFNNLNAQGNSSPFFTVKPVPYVCVNQPYTYNNGVVDPNNDSLRYEMIMPRGGGTPCSMPLNAPNLSFTAASPAYTLNNNPLQTNNTFYLDPNTGQMSFTPTQIGEYVITMLVKEYRGGVLIGTVMRDIQVVVIMCTNPQPTVTQIQNSFIGITPQNGRLEGCAGQPMAFCMDMVSPSPLAELVVQDNSVFAAPGSTVTYNGIHTDSVRACFNWLPSVIDTGLKILTFTVKDSNCINGGIPVSQTFSVPIYIYPVTEILKDTTICRGDSTHLEAVGGGNFVWSVLPGGSPISTLSCTNCKMPWAKPTVTTRYVVTSNLSSICNKNKDTVTITVPTPPQFSAGPDTLTCVNNPFPFDIHLVSSPTTTYTVAWSPTTYLNNPNIPNPVANATNDITYVVTVTPGGINQCAFKDTVNLTVLQGYKLWNGDTAICKGSTININATGDPRYTYTWTPAIGVSNTANLTPGITPDTSRTYVITAHRAGCPDSVSDFTVDVQPVPVVFAGFDQTLCYGDTVHMDFTSALPSSYPYYTYKWTPGGGFSDANILHPIFTAELSTTATLTVTTPAGCSGSDDVTYTVQPGSFIDVSADTAICPGDSAQIHVIGSWASMSWTKNPFIRDTTIGDPYVFPVATTTFHVRARDNQYCLDTGVVTVTVHPAAVLQLPDSVRLFPGESYRADPLGNGLYFSWYPLVGVSNPQIANPVLMPEVNTRYFVSATTESGCRTSDSMEVLVMDDSYLNMPNAFSPGSEPNAIFKVSRNGIASLRYFRVYNRWGTKLFESTDIDRGWDGTYNGEPQPMGVYIYAVEAVTPRGKVFTKQGNVTLIR